MTRDTDERGKLALDAYVTDWARIIWDATGDQTKVDRAILLADLNGMFDPAKFAASRSPAPADGEALREAAFKLSCHDQFRLATFIAENVGYVLAPEPSFHDEPAAPASGGARE